MSTFTFVASIVSLAAFASAQGSHAPTYGRFPCGTLATGPEPFRCTAAQLALYPTPPGYNSFTAITGDTNTFGPQKSAGYVPNDSDCTLAEGTGLYFCGWAGARCAPGTENTPATTCDNGACVVDSDPTNTLGGLCSGVVGEDCGGADANCLGNIYCTRSVLGGTPISTCGQAAPYGSSLQTSGAFCTEPTYISTTNPAQTQANVDTLCDPNAFCSPDGCAFYIATGAACPVGQPYGCVADNTCVNGVCTVNPAPSGRARQRRNNLMHRRGLCPATHSACALPDSRRGFECIDTQTNLEQCGACASAGGVDCTAIPGVDAVGCVAGQCEIWACAEGFTYDPASSSCKAGLVI